MDITGNNDKQKKKLMQKYETTCTDNSTENILQDI